MNSHIKTLETFNPFKSLEYEQANTDQIIDFRIIDFKLLCSKLKPTKTKTYERKDFDLFDRDDFFIKSYDTLIQKFIIEIYPKTQKETFIIKLEANTHLTYLKAYIIFMDDFKYYPNLKFDILQNIYKTMIKQKFLILRLDKKLFQKIDDLILSIQKKQTVKQLELVIAKGVDKIEHKSDKIIYHRSVDKGCFDKKINYNEKTYCKPIQKNELLFEYIYKILGKEGRNLRGEILHINPINFLANPFIIKDESIYSTQTREGIKYFSAHYGFLYKDEKGYSIINPSKLSQIRLTKEDENVSSIVNVQTSDVKVSGNIGPTRIYGKNISIKGLTHEQSEIFAQNVYITTHQGNLEAHTVYIKNLNYGSVMAKNVFVQNCTGAIIKAENIYICNLLTNNTLYPRKNLIIENNVEFKNTINISFLSSIENTADKECENIKNLCLKVKNKLHETLNKMQNHYDYLLTNQIKIEKLQNIKHPNSIEKYKQLSTSYEEFIKLKHQLNTKLNFLDEMIYKVKIYIKAKKIGENNFLKFYPKTNGKLELKHKLGLKDCNKVFYLEKSEQTDCIKSTCNYDESEIKKIKVLFEKLQKDNS